MRQDYPRGPHTRPPSRGREPRRVRAERANAFIVEAMFIAILLVFTVAFISIDRTPSSGTPSRAPMEQAAKDVLHHLWVAGDDTGEHSRQVDRAVAEALQGDPALFESTMRRVMPAGTVYNIVLDNGVEPLRLRWDRASGGESVAAARTWSPSWGTLVALPTVALVDGERAWLEVQAVPIHRALGLRQQAGIEAQVTLELPNGSQVVRTGFAPLMNATGDPPALRVGLVDGGGSMVPVWRPSGGVVLTTVRIQETQDRPLADDTEVVVRLPPGFFNGTILASENTGWDGLSVSGDASSGMEVRATLDGALQNGYRDLVFNATRPLWGEVHRIEVRVGDGSLGAAELVVVDASGTPRTGQDPVGLHPILQLPRATPWKAAAESALVLAYEESEPAQVDVVDIALTFVGGADLLSGSGVWPASGWSSDTSHLNWSGRETLNSGDAVAFRFDLQADAPIDPGSVAGTGLEFETDSDAERNDTLPRQRAAGVFLGRAAPRNATLDGPATSEGVHTATLTGTHRGAGLRGKVSYEVHTADLVRAAAADVARGADGSWLKTLTPKVPVDGEAEMSWDLDALVAELGLADAQFRCYLDTTGSWSWQADRAACDAASALDWQFRKELPDVSLKLLHPAPLGDDGRTLPEVMREDGLAVTGTQDLDLPATAMLGTHPVVLEANLTMAHRNGATHEQTVRLLAAVDVHRVGREPVSAPFYTLSVRAWMPDWG